MENIRQIKIEIKVMIDTNKSTYSENFTFDSLEDEYGSVEETFQEAEEYYKDTTEMVQD